MRNLGVIEIELPKTDKYFRDAKLELYDSYFENRQHETKQEWDKEYDNSGGYTPVRKRRPRIQIPLARTMQDRLVAKLLGGTKFPTFKVEDSPDDQELIKSVIRESRLQAFIMEPVKRMLNTGSHFVRFYLMDGVLKIEHFCSKYCYPVFQGNGELESIEIRYVYTDFKEKNDRGEYVKKWFKMLLTTEREVMYDNPVFDPDAQELPEFTEVDSIEHGFGFVQGEWLRTTYDRNTPDGYALVCDLMDFIDELCYSLSQSSQAVSYNQDPQLVLNGMTEEEVTTLIRSAAKSWNLGKDGDAKFLESALTGVQVASEMRDKIKQFAQDGIRILLLDPEKIVGSAQSAKAMETLYGPMIELIEEIRGMFEPQLKALVLKMTLAVLISSRQGVDVPIVIPPGYQPKSLDVVLKWHPVFQQTIEDLQKKVGAIVSATSANLISRETGTRFLAEDFPIPDGDIDAEIARVAAQPVINPFGSF